MDLIGLPKTDIQGCELPSYIGIVARCPLTPKMCGLMAVWQTNALISSNIPHGVKLAFDPLCSPKAYKKISGLRLRLLSIHFSVCFAWIRISVPDLMTS